MKIAYLSSASIPSTSAHSLQVMKMCQAMAQEGHAVTLVLPPAGEPVSAGEAAKLYGVRIGFEIRRVRLPPILGRRGLAAAEAAEAARISPDLAYTRGLDFAWWASRRGMRTLLEIHHPPTGRLGPLCFRQLARTDPRRVHMAVISRPLEEILRRQYPALADRRLLVAPDAVDLERYRDLPPAREARKRLGLPRERFTAGYFGALVAGRGVELIVELARQLRETTFLLLGGGAKDVAAWKERTSDCGNLRWLGHIPNEEVPVYQAACDALLMPYQRKVTIQGRGDTAQIMSPLKLYEYMAAGRLILASDLPALRAVLKEDNSLLLPCDRIEPWADALRRAAREPAWADALASRAREDVRPFTWRNRVKAILGFLS